MKDIPLGVWSCRMRGLHELAKAKDFGVASLLCTWFERLVVSSALVRLPQEALVQM